VTGELSENHNLCSLQCNVRISYDI